ncbi:MAG TPA: DUF6526 family protein [Gemmatimonadaceae bacterium]|nr:DUF6526 family protein [Gemmatimonadaceae bacterium]
MAGRPQSYANHKRVYPLFHLFLSPVLIANFAFRLIDAIREPSFDSAWAALVAAALYGIAFSARHMALILQNRLISLEQRLRLAQILPDDLRGRVGELKLGQLIALRFASDEELPALTRRCLAGEFAKNDDIKRAVTNWRRDTLRV